LLGSCWRQIPAPYPKPVILVPKAFRDTADLCLNLDAVAESRAAFERLLDQTPKIVKITPV
jgi:hypothetical protein